MITLRVYTVNRDSGDRRELHTEVYEPSAGDLPILTLDLPPCKCPRCKPRVTS